MSIEALRERVFESLYEINRDLYAAAFEHTNDEPGTKFQFTQDTKREIRAAANQAVEEASDIGENIEEAYRRAVEENVRELVILNFGDEPIAKQAHLQLTHAKITNGLTSRLMAVKQGIERASGVELAEKESLLLDWKRQAFVFTCMLEKLKEIQKDIYFDECKVELKNLQLELFNTVSEHKKAQIFSPIALTEEVFANESVEDILAALHRDVICFDDLTAETIHHPLVLRERLEKGYDQLLQLTKHLSDLNDQGKIKPEHFDELRDTLHKVGLSYRYVFNRLTKPYTKADSVEVAGSVEVMEGYQASYLPMAPAQREAVRVYNEDLDRSSTEREAALRSRINGIPAELRATTEELVRLRAIPLFTEAALLAQRRALLAFRPRLTDLNTQIRLEIEAARSTDALDDQVLALKVEYRVANEKYAENTANARDIPPQIARLAQQEQRLTEELENAKSSFRISKISTSVERDLHLGLLERV